MSAPDGIQVELDDSDVQRMLARVASAAGDMRPALASIGTMVTEAGRMAFSAGQTPWGETWDALAQSTVARRRKGSARPLEDTGLLKGSLRVASVDADSVTISAGREHRPAAIHQFGGRAGRNRAAQIPARSFLPIRPGGTVDLPRDLRDDILDLLRILFEQAAA